MNIHTEFLTRGIDALERALERLENMADAKEGAQVAMEAEDD